MFFLLFLSILSIIYCQIEDQQIINIYINEELPISTILFTLTNNKTYRLFDSGRNHNSFIYYNTTNGHILLINSLDREYLCSKHICSCIKCQLIIELIEWQLPYQLLKLLLNIEDINDHIPIFSLENYQLNIRENIPIGYELSLESAYDADLGENSRINYEIKNFTNQPFELITKINGGLSLKIIKNIDREEQDFYQYELIAYDHGQPKKQSSTKLSIQIDDMNDNSVIVSQTYIHLHISENTPIGTELTYINATDKDIGMNGKIHYSITNSFLLDYFRIGESNGILTLINSIDYESEQFYRLTIQIRDLGENSLPCFVNIDISIIDENDNIPQAFITFVHSYINNSIISIYENTPIGQILAHISISDQDSGLNGQLSYKIESGENIIGIKKLENKSFLLIINNLIDREDKNFEINKFILNIYDYGIPSKSIKLEYNINIIDINDSPPIFNQTIKCNININYLTNRSFNQSLFEVQAYDLDLNDNARISYSILPPYDNLFIINNQGKIYCYEYLNQSYYHIKIMANDHGKPIQLNSTYDCFISINNNNIYLNKSISFRNIIKYNYLLIIFSISFILIGICFCFYKKYFQTNKTYHLYVSIPKKSLYIDEKNISNNISEEFIHLNNSEQSSEKDSLSDHQQFSRTIRNSYPSSHDNSLYLSIENSRPGSISTAITCTSIRTDSLCKLNISNSTSIRLAEEENIDT